MNNLLIEEINKFKLLSSYNTKITLNENQNIISEAPKVMKDVISTIRIGDEILRDIVGGLKTKTNVRLNNWNEVINAVEKDLLSPAAYGQLRKSILMKVTDPDIKLAIAHDMALNAKTFQGKTNKQIIDLLTSKHGFTNADAKLVADEYDNIKSGTTGSAPTPGGGTTKTPIQSVRDMTQTLMTKYPLAFKENFWGNFKYEKYITAAEDSVVKQFTGKTEKEILDILDQQIYELNKNISQNPKQFEKYTFIKPTLEKIASALNPIRRDRNNNIKWLPSTGNFLAEAIALSLFASFINGYYKTRNVIQALGYVTGKTSKDVVKGVGQIKTGYQEEEPQSQSGDEQPKKVYIVKKSKRN